MNMDKNVYIFNIISSVSTASKHKIFPPLREDHTNNRRLQDMSPVRQERSKNGSPPNRESPAIPYLSP